MKKRLSNIFDESKELESVQPEREIPSQRPEKSQRQAERQQLPSPPRQKHQSRPEKTEAQAERHQLPSPPPEKNLSRDERQKYSQHQEVAGVFKAFSILWYNF